MAETVADRRARFETVDDALARCPERESHTPGPRDYIAYWDWAREKAKTHKQRRCKGCGRYFVWVARSGEERNG